MGIAIGVFANFAMPLQWLARWLDTRSRYVQVLPAAPLRRPRAIDSRAWNQGVARRAATFSSHRPLRVVRVTEIGCAPHHAGRMRMSGRMADVCAELDRMAEQEALRH